MASKIVFIFIAGISILTMALLLNFLAGKLNISTWYDFVNNPKNAGILDYLWLFILYPFGLGLPAYLISKLIDIN